MIVPFVKTAMGITVYLNDKTYNIGKDHPNYEKVLNMCLSGQEINPADIEGLVNIANSIVKYSEGKIKIDGEVFQYNGFELHNSLTERILNLLQQSQSITILTAFLENLMKNPSRTSVNELYGFLEKSSLPITPDGCFLAYKKVRKDYLDIYSSTINNKPGTIVEMPRNMVNDNREQTCSHGLHCCAFGYLEHYNSSDVDDRIVIVKVNPADVVSVPADYNDQKMRVCKYEVVGEIPNDDLTKLMNWVCSDYWTIENIRKDIQAIKSYLKNRFDLEEEPKYNDILLSTCYESIDENDEDEEGNSSIKTLPLEEIAECEAEANSILSELSIALNLNNIFCVIDGEQRPKEFPEISVRSLFEWVATSKIAYEKVTKNN